MNARQRRLVRRAVKRVVGEVVREIAQQVVDGWIEGGTTETTESLANEFMQALGRK